MSGMTLTFTALGLAALVNAQANGSNSVLVSKVGLANAAFTVAGTLTSLPNEIKKLTTIGGSAVDPATIALSVRDDSADAYDLFGFGLYLNDGTLFAVYSQSTRILGKASISQALIALDVRLAAAVAANIQFGATNFLDPPATTERAGLVELATAAEAVSGTDDQRAITPVALKAKADAVTVEVKAYADAKKAEAISAAATDATSKSNAAQAAAVVAAGTAADTKDATNLAAAKTYADTKKAEAIAAAATDADTRDATNLAAAKAYADAKKTEAISAASTDATSKSNAAQAAAIAAAGTAADTKDASNLTAAKTYADTKKAEAISAAAADATTKSDAAKATAISTAADDATAKADAAKVTAINTANAHSDGLITGGSNSYGQWTRFPDGSICQRGRYTGTVNQASYAVTFPMQFPSACENMTGVARASGGTTDGYDIWLQVVLTTTDGATICIQSSAQSASGTGFDWVAWGR